MEKINKLRNIWENIPSAVTAEIDVTQKELISQFMDFFHVGDYFYIIFNTQNAEMEYVCPSVEKVLGFKPKHFNLQLIMDNIHPDDLPYYYHYEQSAVRFFSSLPEELFFKYKFAYDYRLKSSTGEFKRVQQQIIPIYYFPEGGARTLGVFTDLSHLNIMGIPKLSFIGMQGAASYYNVHLSEEFRIGKEIFTPREKEILKYMIQGKKSEEISLLLNRSIFTIRNHRKNILEKSACQNLQELLVKAIREGWV